MAEYPQIYQKQTKPLIAITYPLPGVLGAPESFSISPTVASISQSRSVVASVIQALQGTWPCGPFPALCRVLGACPGPGDTLLQVPWSDTSPLVSHCFPYVCHSPWQIITLAFSHYLIASCVIMCVSRVWHPCRDRKEGLLIYLTQTALWC